MLRNLIVVLWLSGFSLVAAAEDFAAPSKGGSPQIRQLGPINLRGFGKVAVQSRSWTTPVGDVSLACFTAESPAKAKIVASKYLADLQNYGAVTRSKESGVTLEVRHGGYWRLGLRGNLVMVASAPTVVALRQAVENWQGDQWQPVPEQAYPRYLDNFDNAALAIWWMPSTKKPEEMKWMQDNPVIANLHHQNLSLMVAPNVLDNSGPAHAAAQLRSLGKPFRTMLWTGDGKSAWFSWMNLPSQEFESYPEGFSGLNLFEAAGYYTNQTSTDLLNDLQINSLELMMERWKDDPDLLAWMEPHGEFQLFQPANVPPTAKTDFPAYLREKKKYDLDTLFRQWIGHPGAFKSWDVIPYPDDAYFVGRRGSFIDLDEHDWKWQSASLADGTKQGFMKNDFNDADWFCGKRTSKRLLAYSKGTIAIPGAQKPTSLWTRFDAEIPASFLQNKAQVYLHIMPFTNRHGRELSVWVNGQQAADKLVDKDVSYQNAHSEVEISRYLKPGSNRFVIFSAGGRIAYRVFLNHAPADKFPYTDRGINQQFLDWRDYLRHAKFLILEKYLRVMRAVDPNRPIKVMTPNQWLSDSFDLFEKYGAYPQLTGECNWYRPMHYKGYTALRDRLSSSEPGGFVNNARDGQNMYAMAFTESQDCHDYGFDFTRDFWRFPQVVKWWTDNRALLGTFGKTNLETNGLGLLRDTYQEYRYANGQIWNWDLARGPLPALGLTPVLVDGADLIKGLADGKVSVLFDCATIVTNPAMVDAIKRYVAQGGIFVAQQHTGQHSELIRNAWPLPQAFGLKISNRPVGSKILFSVSQNLFPSLRGKQLEGGGVSIAWDGKADTGAVAIHGEKAIPVATWSDGSMAIAECNYGKGRFIMLGTPFYLRIKDDTGKWLNDDARQQLLAELLNSLGIKRTTAVADSRLWFERRSSKNGLYDVYFACAMGWKGKDWKLTDRLNSELLVDRPAAAAAIDATAIGAPDITTRYQNGQLSLGKQEFSPYQVRQFAVVRDHVGLDAPIHWLKQQQQAWYALPPVTGIDLKRPRQIAAAFAQRLGEDGIDLSRDWRVQVNPGTDEVNWINIDTANWKTGAIGSWLSQGWADATQVRYRKEVELPASWRDGKSRVYLGLAGWQDYGILDHARLWINGKLVDSQLKKQFLRELPAELFQSGKLKLALEVTGKPQPGKALGPIGTLYLRRTHRPVATIDLKGEWTRLASMIKANGKVNIPFKGSTFGLSRQVVIPADWKGKMIRLVVDEDPSRDRNWGRCGGVIINSENYLRENGFWPIGVRVDRYLKPGETNTIDLFGGKHDDAADPKPFQADIRNIRLEAFSIQP